MISKVPYSLYITRIPGFVDQESLLNKLSTYGQISDCYIAKRRNGNRAGYGYVIASDESTYKALREHKPNMGGRELILIPFRN
jgi:RNA recognition motif-containing protein